MKKYEKPEVNAYEIVTEEITGMNMGNGSVVQGVPG